MVTVFPLFLGRLERALGAAIRACAAVIVLGAIVSPLDARAEDVLLTISSELSSSGGPIQLTRSELTTLPQVEVQTTTEWTDGRPVFEGPLARDVIERMPSNGEKVANAIALNDFSVEIPLSDFERYNVILALRMNGRELSLRDKGPIWIVYPRDEHNELLDPSFNSRWIWQLDRLQLR